MKRGWASNRTEARRSPRCGGSCGMWGSGGGWGGTEPNDVAGPADDRVTVRVGGKGHCDQRLREGALWVRLVALSPLLFHNLALGVKLPEDRILHPVGFQDCPQLQAIARNVHIVLRPIP